MGLSGGKPNPNPSIAHAQIPTNGNIREFASRRTAAVQEERQHWKSMSALRIP